MQAKTTPMPEPPGRTETPALISSAAEKTQDATAAGSAAKFGGDPMSANDCDAFVAVL